jgi:hypothetical protein
MTTSKRYIRDTELSQVSGIPLPTLRADRQRDRRIPYLKIGRSCYYDTASVFDVIAEKFGTGGERKPGAKIPKTVRKVATIKRGVK